MPQRSTLSYHCRRLYTMNSESINNHSPASFLSDATKRRGLLALLAGSFFMGVGYFMVIPLIAVHYIDGLRWAAASIGLVLGIRQLTQQGLTLFGGMLADRLGAKGLIC